MQIKRKFIQSIPSILLSLIMFSNTAQSSIIFTEPVGGGTSPTTTITSGIFSNGVFEQDSQCQSSADSNCYFGNEFSDNLDDLTTSKYYNYNPNGLVGIFFERNDLSKFLLDNFRIASANDMPDRDPTGLSFYGTNVDGIVGKSLNDFEFITSTTFNLPENARNTLFSFANPLNTPAATPAFRNFLVTIDSVRDPSSDGVQLAELHLIGTESVSVPEPSTLLLFLISGLLIVVSRVK